MTYFIFTLLLGLLLFSCSEPSPAKEKPANTKAPSEQSAAPKYSSVTDSIFAVSGHENRDACVEFLYTFSETQNTLYLDSAVAEFELLTTKNRTAFNYLQMGASCEALEQYDLAKLFYLEGRKVNNEEQDLPDESDNHYVINYRKLQKVYDAYFAILLNEPYDREALENAEPELLSHPFFSDFLSAEGHSRDGLLEHYC